MASSKEELGALLARLSEDKLSGSRHLALVALRALELYLLRAEEEPPSLYRGALQLAKDMAALRPNMAAIANALAEVLHVMGTQLQAREARQVGLHAIERVASELRGAAQRTARAFRALVEPGGVYVTLSSSETVREGLLAARPALVYVCESRPRLEGRALARQLKEAGLEAILIPDVAASFALERASALVLGADVVYPDGRFVNKAGSKLLCCHASRLQRPVYVLFDRWKLWPLPPASFSPEQDDPSLLTQGEPGLRAEVPLFEVVEPPATLVHVSEFGPLREHELRARAQERLLMLRALMTN
ncbi:MAG: hypothetical protein C4339_05275 [Nitrososphaerota archaeon]